MLSKIKINPSLGFLLMTFLFIDLNVEGQTRTEQAQIDVRENLQKLYEGALLVRLLVRTETTERLRDRGLEAEAVQIESEQREKNLEYATAFDQGYDFSSVYYFSSNDSKLVKAGRLDEITFFNSNLEPDESIKVTQKNIFTAEFGIVKQSNECEQSGYRLQKDSTGVVQKETYYGSPNFGFSAIVIMNDQFEQLGRPFPYYVRYTDGFSFLRPKPATAVKKLNAKLYQSL